MITKARDNKIILSENTLIFEQSGTKIITGIPDAEVATHFSVHRIGNY